jgi:hypothetical protein
MTGMYPILGAADGCIPLKRTGKDCLQMATRLTFMILAGFALCVIAAVMWLSLDALQEAIANSGAPSSKLPEYITMATIVFLLNISGFIATYRYVSKDLILDSAVNRASTIGVIVIIVLGLLVMAFSFVALIGAGGRVSAAYYFLFTTGRFMAVTSSVICWIWWGSLFLHRSDSI